MTDSVYEDGRKTHDPQKLLNRQINEAGGDGNRGKTLTNSIDLSLLLLKYSALTVTVADMIKGEDQEKLQQLPSLTCTRALTTSIGLVTVEAVAAARGPAMACRMRWGQSVGAILESCSVQY